MNWAGIVYTECSCKALLCFFAVHVAMSVNIGCCSIQLAAAYGRLMIPLHGSAAAVRQLWWGFDACTTACTTSRHDSLV